MSKSTQQSYYNQHYSISDSTAWKTWVPKANFVEKQNLSEFKNSFWQADAQESVLAALAEFAPFDAVLDIGCSAGDFLIPLSRASTRVYGVDIVDFSVAWKLLRHEYGICCQQLNLDYANLPFDNSSFDVVTMLMVLEHVFDVHHAVREIARVLKKGGVVAIQVPNIAYLKHRIDLLKGKLPCTSDTTKSDNQTEWDGQHLHYFTLASLDSLLKQYGLHRQKVQCSGKLVGLRQLRPSFLGADLTVFARKLAE
ncbi:class I SAM-dependent methyltransferase [Egbenema bharatensis]|uniref:class I SAM-dependent methyltransferase n=1 Tax=Egbenema bharatensis TaxID=3463334 RepID=UPI003A841794